MHPILFTIFGFDFPSWHVCYVLAAFAAFFFLRASLWRTIYPIALEDITILYSACYGAATLGARALGVFYEQGAEVNFLAELFRLGPMISYGGILAAAFAVFLTCKIRKLPILAVGDLAVPASLLAMAIGRIGCFLNGDDFGQAIPESGGALPFWAVTFKNHAEPIARYPVQLFETFILLLLVALLTYSRLRIWQKLGQGGIFFLGLFCYAFERFMLEFWRGDERPFWQGLSEAQWLCLFFAIFAIWALRGFPKTLSTRPQRSL